MGAGPVQRQQVRRRPAIVAETRPRERLFTRAHFRAIRSVQQHASEHAGATHVAMAAAAVGARHAVSAVRAVPSRARYRAAVSAPRQRDAPRATGRLDDARYQVASPRVCLADDLTEQPLAVAVSVCFRLRCLLACLHVVWCRSCLSGSTPDTTLLALVVLQVASPPQRRRPRGAMHPRDTDAQMPTPCAGICYGL